jgi:ligand-binding sensor domain-containing protein
MYHWRKICEQFCIATMLISLFSCGGDKGDHPTRTIPFNTSSAVPVTVPDSLLSRIDKNIRSIFQDRSGKYWFGTNAAGVYRYDGTSLRQFTTNDGLADNQVLNIQEDESGNIWFSSGSFAISKFDGKTLDAENIIRINTGRLKNWNSIPHDLWFGGGGGLIRSSKGELDYLPFDSTRSSTKASPYTLGRFGVYCILKDKKGDLWFGTQAEGVCRYDGKTLTWFREEGLAGPAVLSLFQDSKGILWFGNNGGGLFRFDGKNLVNFTKEKKLDNADFRATGKPNVESMGRVYSINEDNSGNLWIGTVDAGVWKYDGSSLVHYTTRDGLSSNAVNTIYRDRQGHLWFGTDSNGICKFDGKRFIRI